jgi:hypothetical protein
MALEDVVRLVIDGVIVLTVMEVILLAVIHRRSGRGVAPSEILLNVLSGLSLMLALRIALSGSPSVLVLGALLLAGIFHGLDILRRWRR